MSDLHSSSLDVVKDKKERNIFAHDPSEERESPIIPGVVQSFEVKKDILNIIASILTNDHLNNNNLNNLNSQTISNKLYKQFLGSQPVSFARKHVEENLLAQDYYVCEKTDGIRLLMFVIINPQTNKQSIFFIDRENNFYLKENLNIILPFNEKELHNGTLIDGELVNQKINGKIETRFLMFDCLAINGRPFINKSTSSRLAHLGHDFLKPLNEFKFKDPKRYSTFEFKFGMKKMEFAYNLGKIFKQIEKKQIPHFSDGLIFTPVNTRYVLFTKDELLLKWKPSSENSVDFKMVFKFENDNDVNKINFDKIPVMDLYVWKGGEDKSYIQNPNSVYTHKDLKILSETYSKFGRLKMEQDTWKMLLKKNEPLNGRIVECYKNNAHEWCFLRFRDDKLQGNHINVVSNILSSIQDNVKDEELEQSVETIKINWNKRHTK
ncbi:hypothetical protein QEN19_000358 [Hanseniaspora menglaensis]